MKKSLLSLLAVAVAAVGCQNYDDQFDDLNSQIAALSSQVAGLAQVQNDLSALSQTVSNLQAGVAQTVDSALSGALDSIDDAIAQLEAAADTAASAEDVQAIADALVEQDAVLEEVLANSSVHTGDVVIGNSTQLEAWHALKGTLVIVNGSVDIDVDSTMDTAKIQDILDVIVTVTEEFSYVADSTSDYTPSFPELSGTATLTLDFEGNVVLPKLAAATVVSIDEDSSTAVVDLGALKSVTSLSNGEGAGTFHFGKATNVHLTSLASYDGDLSIEVDDNAAPGVILLDAYRDVDEDGDATGDNLTIIGATSFTVSELVGTGSTLTLKDVTTATVNGYNGTIVTDSGVEIFSADHVVSWTVSGTDLVSVDVTGALDADADAEDEVGPSITLDGQGDLTSVDIDGTTGALIIQNNGNLTSVTIGGTVTAAGGIKIHSNSDLSSIDVSEATTDKLVVSSNGDLERLVVDFTTAAGDADEQVGTITIDSNESLTYLEISTDNVDNLSITNNVDLSEIDLSGMTAIGEAATPAVYITGNDLNATEADGENESFTTDSGMDTAAAYLTAVAAVGTDAVGEVHFDVVDTVLDEDGDEESTDTADYIVWKSGTDAVVEGAYTATVEKRAFIIDLSVDSSNSAKDLGLQLSVDGVQVLHNGSDYGAVTMIGTQVIDKGALLTNLATTRATDLGFELDVIMGGNYTFGDITFLTSISSVSNGEYFSNTAAYNTTSKTSYLTTYDEFTISVGGRSARASIAAGYTDVASRLARALTLAWGKKWASDGSSANFSFWTTAVNDYDVVIEAPSLRSSNSGSRAGNDEISITWNTRATAAQVSIVTSGARTESVIDWTYADDEQGTSTEDLIIYLTEVTDGVISSGNATLISSVATGIQELTTNLLSNASAQNTDTTTTIYPTDARGDVVANEAADEGVVTSAAVAAINRATWL